MAAQPHWPKNELWGLFDLAPVSGIEIDAYLSITLARCVEWFKASGGSVFWAEGGSKFPLRAKCGEQARLPDDALIRRGKGIAGVVAASGIARLIDNPQVFSDLAMVPPDASIASSMVLPLKDSAGAVVGVLNMSRGRGERAFRDEDLDQAIAVARYISLAVANAQLLSQLKEKAAEAQLVNERLSAVFDSVAGGVVVVDGSGAVVDKNTLANEQILSGNSGQLSDDLPSIIWEALLGNHPTKDTVHDSGADRTWLVETRPLDSGGAVVTTQEITGYERSRRELDRTRRLAEIGQMTAQIAHEIRNPLTGIRSAAQMIAAHPELCPEFIGAIEEEAMKLNALCDEFLEFARPMQLNLDESNLGEVIGGVVKSLTPLAANLGVEIELENKSSGLVEIDARRIGQVAHNLLRNAFQASQPGQRVQVRIDDAGFSVFDAGCGLKPDELTRLFTAFFTTKAGGSGLGLATSRKIIDAHGGTISVVSEVGKGSEFRVHLTRKES